MKQNKGICSQQAEEIILKGSDKLVEQRVLARMEENEKISNEQNTKSFEYKTEFSQLSADEVFSEYAHYKLFNPDTRREFFIDGKALESKIGLDTVLYDKLKNRSIMAFELGEYLIKFVRCKVPKSQS